MHCQGVILSRLVYFSLDLLLYLVGRIAGYVTRMSGDVGGALSDGRPYPDGCPVLNIKGKADCAPYINHLSRVQGREQWSDFPL